MLILQQILIIRLLLSGNVNNDSLSHSLSYDRCINSFKVSSPISAIYCFLFQVPVSFRFLKVFHQLFTSSFSSSHTFYLPFNNMFQKAVPTQDVSNQVALPSFYCVQDVQFLLDTIHYFSFSTLSIQLVFSVFLQDHAKLCSKCSYIIDFSCTFKVQKEQVSMMCMCCNESGVGVCVQN